MFKKLFLTALMTAVLTTAVCAQNQNSQGERIALQVKPAVVRVFDGYVGTAVWQGNSFTKTYNLDYVGAGSGAFIDPDGYIVTNAHVINLTHQDKGETEKTLLKLFAAQVAHDYKMTVDQLNENDWNAIINAFRQTAKFREIQTVILPSGDKYPFNITNGVGSPVGDGKDVAIIKIEIKNAPSLKLADSEKVHVQDHITVVGYPAAAESEILDNKSLLQSSITDGKVSAKKNMTDGSPVLEVSAPATHGNSGGPVVNDAGEIVGLLTFGGNNVGGQEIQGFNFVVASNTVKEFVKQAGATNEAGTADKAYQEGLDLYFKGRYRSALEKFQQVNNLFPQHSEVKPLIQECETKKDTETNSRAVALVVIGLLLLVGSIVLVIIAGAAIFYQLTRKKQVPSFHSAPFHGVNAG